MDYLLKRHFNLSLSTTERWIQVRVLWDSTKTYWWRHCQVSYQCVCLQREEEHECQAWRRESRLGNRTDFRSSAQCHHVSFKTQIETMRFNPILPTRRERQLHDLPYKVDVKMNPNSKDWTQYLTHKRCRLRLWLRALLHLALRLGQPVPYFLPSPLRQCSENFFINPEVPMTRLYDEQMNILDLFPLQSFQKQLRGRCSSQWWLSNKWQLFSWIIRGTNANPVCLHFTSLSMAKTKLNKNNTRHKGHIF